MKPWAVEALKIFQDVDVVVKQLKQTLESVTVVTEGPTLQNLVDIAQNSIARNEGVFPPMVDANKHLQAKMQTP